MTSRKTSIDKDAARKLRAELYEQIDRGELSLQDAVKRMRKISRLSQPEFATHLGVSVKVVKEIERGVGNPTVSSLNRIGQFFGLEVAFVRSEKLRDQATQKVSASESLMAESVNRTSTRSAIDEVRQLFEELEQIKRQVVPEREFKDTLNSMEQELQAIRNATDIAERSARSSEAPLTDLDRVARVIDTELDAVKKARGVIDSVEKIQRQLQPPPAVQQWIAAIEAANRMLKRFEAPSSQVSRHWKKSSS